ncbi:MAG: hypothetical protein ACREXX_04255 [Gammaproteobacteria bacterium]
MTTAWFRGVQRWTLPEIEADVAIARADFRARRLGEPLVRYLAAFDAAHPRLRQLVGEIDRVLAGGPARPLEPTTYKPEGTTLKAGNSRRGLP